MEQISESDCSAYRQTREYYRINNLRLNYVEN